MKWTYVDSSAFTKLLIDELETDELENWLDGRQLVSSSLLRTEVARATRRSDPAAFDESLIDDALSEVLLYSIDDLIMRRAGVISYPDLRTLDAIHLATAVRMEEEIDGFVTYDRKLATAVAVAGIQVFAPA